MNRIILIGNGFDLAHGLNTSYKHFINDYWCNVINDLREMEFLKTFKNNEVEFLNPFKKNDEKLKNTYR